MGRPLVAGRNSGGTLPHWKSPLPPRLSRNDENPVTVGLQRHPGCLKGVRPKPIFSSVIAQEKDMIRLTKTLSAALALILAAATAHTKALKKWKYAGEDHGIRFFYTEPRGAKNGSILLKLENTLDMPVGISFRVKDTEWNKAFEAQLAPGATDSSLTYRPEVGLGVRFPFIDRVFVEDAGEPRGETAGR